MPLAPFTPPCGLDIAATTIEADDMSRISYWGYRLVVHGDGMCFVHEAYYDDREGLLGVALAPARPCADSREELRAELDLMAEALAEPALRYADFAKDPQRFGRYEGLPDVTDHPGRPDAGDGAAGDGEAGEPPAPGSAG